MKPGCTAAVSVQAASDRACAGESDGILDIVEVRDKKWAAIQYMHRQEHLWHFHENVAENRGNRFHCNSGGQAGGHDCRHTEAFQSVFRRTVDEL